MGRDLQEIKPLAEDIFALARELLRLVDMDEQERRRRIEELKKTRTAKLFVSRRTGGRPQQRHYAKVGNTINQKGD